MASDNNDGWYLNLAQKIGHKDVTCMCCKHFQEINTGYCYLAEKNNNLDTPAYDCPNFEYDEYSMPKEAYEEKKKEEELKKQEDDAQRSNTTLAIIVVFVCLISIGIVVSHASNSFEVLFDIAVGAVITFVLVHLIRH